MKKIISRNDRKYFFKLSLYIVIVYVTMFVTSLVVAILNYFVSKGGAKSWIKWVALILSTIHSILIIVNWIALKLQKSRIDYVKNTTMAWLMTIVMDLLSTFCMVCNTITSLIDGGVLQTNATWLLPMMSFVTFGFSVLNFALSLYFLHVAKKSVRENKTL